MDWMRIVGERKIKEAMDAGVFDDNPLKGQPLNYDEDMGLPPEQRVVKKILKNAGALPQWMQLEVDIKREREATVKQKERALKLLAKAPLESRERVKARLKSELKESMSLVNTMILQYNMVCPAGYARPFAPFGIQKEMEQLGVE
ncbi:DnaJ family domain-containing protein [Armatimonas sp.]|uniref:DnaJ family domain-containing protein n=1 Tax=Armatimonas sp. TaxID=1872638 RepID=UPI00286D2AD2|nr:DnaJ family domain-containing protein [Armatimonas sp.]